MPASFCRRLEERLCEWKRGAGGGGVPLRVSWAAIGGGDEPNSCGGGEERIGAGGGGMVELSLSSSARAGSEAGIVPSDDMSSDSSGNFAESIALVSVFLIGLGASVKCPIAGAVEGL
jgi:hypothetical protein